MAAGGTVNDEYKLSYLFLALPPSYDAVTTSLENKDNLDLNEARRRLLAEEIKQNGRHQPGNDENASALHGKKKFTNKKLFNGKCHECGESGHNRFKCPKLRQGGWQRGANFANGSAGVSMVATIGENFSSQEPEITAVAMVANNANEVVWELDSGASDHMCNDVKLFHTIEDLVVV